MCRMIYWHALLRLRRIGCTRTDCAIKTECLRRMRRACMDQRRCEHVIDRTLCAVLKKRRRHAGLHETALPLFAFHAVIGRRRRKPRRTLTVVYTDRTVQIALQQRYKFTLAFENTAQADYVSERWWDALIAGSVPVRAFPVRPS